MPRYFKFFHAPEPPKGGGHACSRAIASRNGRKGKGPERPPTSQVTSEKRCPDSVRMIRCVILDKGRQRHAHGQRAVVGGAAPLGRREARGPPRRHTVRLRPPSPTSLASG